MKKIFITFVLVALLTVSTSSVFADPGDIIKPYSPDVTVTPQDDPGDIIKPN